MESRSWDYSDGYIHVTYVHKGNIRMSNTTAQAADPNKGNKLLIEKVK